MLFINATKIGFFHTSSVKLSDNSFEENLLLNGSSSESNVLHRKYKIKCHTSRTSNHSTSNAYFLFLHSYSMDFLCYLIIYLIATILGAENIS